MVSAYLNHQTFQVPKMDLLTYISCMDIGRVKEKPPPTIAEHKLVQDSS